MIYGKEECKKLADCHAAVLIEDFSTENGTPVIVVRRVADYGVIRSAEASFWYVRLNLPLKDGSDCIYPHLLLGYRTKDTADIFNLEARINTRYSLLPEHERLILISDAIYRLKEVML